MNISKASWCLGQQWSRRRRLLLQPVTLTRLRDSPGRRWRDVRFVDFLQMWLIVVVIRSIG